MFFGGGFRYTGRLLHRLASLRSLAVVTTNYAFPGGGGNHRDGGGSGTPKAGLGVTWAHVPDMRLHVTNPDPQRDPEASTGAYRVPSMHTEYQACMHTPTTGAARVITVVKSNRTKTGFQCRFLISGSGLLQE